MDPLEKQLDTLGPIASRGRFVWPSVKYVNETEEKDVASNPEFFWTRPCHRIELDAIHFSCKANNVWYSDMYFNTDWQFEMFKRGKENMDMILCKYKLQNYFPYFQ